METFSLHSFERAAIPTALNKHLFCAEIIESTLRSYTALAWQWDHYPPFGSLVFVPHEEYTIFGCITAIETGSLDQSRIPMAYQKTAIELQQEQPQIFEFLRTLFTVRILGYRQNKTSAQLRYALPPKPPKIHQFVGLCPTSIHKIFFEQQEYLHLLFASPLAEQSVDDVLIAIISNLIAQSIPPGEIVNKMCSYFPLFVGNDYRRMRSFLRRLELLIEMTA